MRDHDRKLPGIAHQLMVIWLERLLPWFHVLLVTLDSVTDIASRDDVIPTGPTASDSRYHMINREITILKMLEAILAGEVVSDQKV